jgi:ATP-dependent RNA helicase DeaD
MPAPIKKLAKKYIKDPVHIILNDNKKTPENLKHFYVYTRPEEKTDCVSTILKEHNITQALIFCNTRKTVETLFKKLYKAGFDIKMLHGGVEQKNRDHVAGSFKCGELKYIVATDIMARGLDYDNITHIIHFDLPNDKETYIHRSGRAARLGRDGEAVSILTKRDKRYFDQYMKSTSLSASELVVNFKISSDSLSKTGKSKNNLKSNSKSNSKSKPINKSLSKTKNDIKSKSNSNTQTRKKSGPSQRKIEKSPQPVSADSGSTKEFFSSKKIIKRKK